MVKHIIFRSFKIFTGKLCTPDDLWESRGNIIQNMSFLSVVAKKNVFVFLLDGTL